MNDLLKNIELKHNVERQALIELAVMQLSVIALGALIYFSIKKTFK